MIFVLNNDNQLKQDDKILKLTGTIHLDDTQQLSLMVGALLTP